LHFGNENNNRHNNQNMKNEYWTQSSTLGDDVTIMYNYISNDK